MNIILKGQPRIAGPLDFFAQDNPCENCGSTNLTVEMVSNRYWTGATTLCEECGQFSEYDQDEEPADHRSAEW